MDFNFTTVQKNHWYSQALPTGIIRLEHRYIRLAQNITDRFLTSMSVNEEQGYESIAVALAFDRDKKALKLMSGLGVDPRHSSEAYQFKLSSNGAATTIPRPLVRAGMPVGDYRETQEGSNIFVLAE